MNCKEEVFGVISNLTTHSKDLNKVYTRINQYKEAVNMDPEEEEEEPELSVE